MRKRSGPIQMKLRIAGPHHWATRSQGALSYKSSPCSETCLRRYQYCFDPACSNRALELNPRRPLGSLRNFSRVMMAVDLTTAKILACLRARETVFTGAECQENAWLAFLRRADERGSITETYLKS